MTHALALLGLLALAQPQPSETGVVRGVITSERSGEPLPSTVIEIESDAGPLITLADSAGDYVLRDVPAGHWTLRASRFDHEPLEIDLVVWKGAEIELDLMLGFRPVALPAVIASARTLAASLDRQIDPSADLGVTTLRSLEATPGMIELGLGDVVRVTPSPDPIDPSDILYVRGTPSDLKLVYLDGAPVYSPFHLGGLIAAFEPRALESVSHYLGGAPARYDGGLSYVLDLESRPGRRSRFHTVGEVDLLSSNVLVEGPVGSRAGVLAGWRSVHGLGSAWMVEDAFPYAYTDLLARADLDIGYEGRLAVTGFWNNETVEISPHPQRSAQTMWGNGAVSARYTDRIGESQIEVTSALGSYRTQLPFGNAERMATDGDARRGRLAADVVRSLTQATLYYGLSYDHVSLTHQAWADAFMPYRSLLVEAMASGSAAGAYADLGWQPVRQLRLRGGVRADRFSMDETIRLAPRLSVSWLVSDRARLTLAAGRYRQLVRSSGPILMGDGVDSEPMLHLHPPLALARASHLLLALDQELVEGFRLGIEGYYKEYAGMPTTPTASGAPAAPHTDATEATASGVDIWFRRASGGVTGWLAYSLGWVWSASEDERASDAFAGRHLLSMGLASGIGPHGRIELRLAYGAGLPYSAVPAPFEPEQPTTEMMRVNAAITGRLLTDDESPTLSGPPDSPYLRLDAEASHAWHREWAGRPITFTPYLKVLNALDRRDALFYHVNERAGGEVRPIASLPLLPIIGIEWTF